MTAGVAILQKVVLVRKILIIARADIDRSTLIQQFETILVCQRMAARTVRAGTESQRKIGIQIPHIGVRHTFTDVFMPDKALSSNSAAV